MNLLENIKRIKNVMGINESHNPWFRRRFNIEELDFLIKDVEELIEYGTDPDTAVYDAVREFIKERKFSDIDEFGNDSSYWESYLMYEKPLVNYVKERLRN